LKNSITQWKNKSIIRWKKIKKKVSTVSSTVSEEKRKKMVYKIKADLVEERRQEHGFLPQASHSSTNQK